MPTDRELWLNLELTNVTRERNDLVEAVSYWIKFNSFGNKFCSRCDTKFPNHSKDCMTKPMADIVAQIEEKVPE